MKCIRERSLMKMTNKKIRLDGIGKREIDSRYQLAKEILDNLHIEYREEKGLKRLWLLLNADKHEEIELFFTHGHITAYFWRCGQDFEREECADIEGAFQYFNQRLERSRKNQVHQK